MACHDRGLGDLRVRTRKGVVAPQSYRFAGYSGADLDFKNSWPGSECIVSVGNLVTKLNGKPFSGRPRVRVVPGRDKVASVGPTLSRRRFTKVGFGLSAVGLPAARAATTSLHRRHVRAQLYLGFSHVWDGPFGGGIGRSG